MKPAGLAYIAAPGDNRFMTISYRDGRSVQAALLSRDKNVLRAAIPGMDDVCAFERVNGTWISHDCEPVTIRFEWEFRHGRERDELEEQLARFETENPRVSQAPSSVIH